MKQPALKSLVAALILVCAGLTVSACNTTKATLDTFAKFTSSTSPGEWVTADGLIQESQKARLFAAVAFENLEQDMARGNGEYLSSLVTLMNIPSEDQDAFRVRAQTAYPLLLASDERTAEGLLATLTSRKGNQ